MPCPPMSKFSSTMITDAPFSSAAIAAARPETPAPMATKSADWSQRRVWASTETTGAAPPTVRTVAPRPAVAPLRSISLRLTFLCLL